MGAVNGAQIFKALCVDHTDWQDRFNAGDLAFVGNWLEQKVWSTGCELSSQELMKQITGRETETEDYLAHLRSRYLDEIH